MAATDQTVPASAPRGRRRDPSRDAAILTAALDVVADVGLDGLTMDAVASRAKAGKATVYRRWGSKTDLIQDAIGQLAGGEVDHADLPDTGSLRGDLLALAQPSSVEDQDRKLRIMAGLGTVMVKDPTLARAVHDAVIGPWIHVNQALMRRAIDRGELPDCTDVELLSQVLPSMVAFRTMIARSTDDADLPYIAQLIDGVLLPAIHGATGRH